MRRKLAAGNWKMNGTGESLAEVDRLLRALPDPCCEVLICPPATLLHRMAARLEGATVALGGQTCHAATCGAHTGDISAAMLADAGASHVILGHSERRAEHGESDLDIRAMTEAAWDAGLAAIVCVGETDAEREAVNTLDIVGGQMASSIPDAVTGENLIVAYEPVWAIGTGRTPSLDEIGEVHDFIRARLERRFGPGVGRSVRILYGGSMKPGNAAEIAAVSNVDGGLIGGASLTADDFAGIIRALSAGA
ncbi:triose-phosphate isomerase [Maritimibacter sp. 55A14]|uniref:triose-phosphate isomerase n=1 Tax=Maritimibacter sp. 55A14 TaxID=2174844 RepID=UPI000D621729|nr:triose-phosphate isomerase [Maritimibacter sp. 55A14]PWE28838.1 triose-phosphate isomerase [Maritimibacter sp. 55A14]